MEFLSPNLPEITKAELYRECFNIGGGIVNNESFFIAATEYGYFAKTLRIRSLKKTPSIDKDNQIIPNEP